MNVSPTKPDQSEVESFYRFIHTRAHGKENAMTARVLSDCLGFGSGGDRRLRLLVHAANEAGYLILADNVGYFEPATPQECDEAIGRIESQAHEMLERGRRIKALITARFYSEQIGLGI